MELVLPNFPYFKHESALLIKKQGKEENDSIGLIAS